jgi:hypothetical protein
MERIGVAAAKSMESSRSKVVGSRIVRNFAPRSGMNITKGKLVCGVEFIIGLWHVSVRKGYWNSKFMRFSSIVSECVCYGYKNNQYLRSVLTIYVSVLYS